MPTIQELDKQMKAEGEAHEARQNELRFRSIAEGYGAGKINQTKAAEMFAQIGVEVEFKGSRQVEKKLPKKEEAK